MISTLISLLGSFYENKDFAKAEDIAQRIHLTIPGDEVSLKFLGLVYYRTGRVMDAMKMFDRVQCKQNASSGALSENAGTLDSAVIAVSQEASRRVPYLALAWRDLGSTLTKMRESQTVRMACVA